MWCKGEDTILQPFFVCGGYFEQKQKWWVTWEGIYYVWVNSGQVLRYEKHAMKEKPLIDASFFDLILVVGWMAVIVSKSEVPTAGHQWCSGNITAFQAVALGSIPGWCIYYCHIAQRQNQLPVLLPP